MSMCSYSEMMKHAFYLLVVLLLRLQNKHKKFDNKLKWRNNITLLKFSDRVMVWTNVVPLFYG